MTSIRLALITLAALCFGACSQSAKSGPLVPAFKATGCKANYSSGSLLAYAGPVLQGMQCVAWKRQDGLISIDLINFPGGCGFLNGDEEQLWQAEAALDAGVLRLAVTWDFEFPNSCGSCLHDFSAEVAGTPADLSSLVVSVADCTDRSLCRDDRYEVPWHKNGDMGLVCRLAPLPGATQDVPGSLHALADDSGCQEGLEMFEVSDDEIICVAPCSSDSDCPLPGLACRASRCLPVGL